MQLSSRTHQGSTCTHRIFQTVSETSLPQTTPPEVMNNLHVHRVRCTFKANTNAGRNIGICSLRSPFTARMTTSHINTRAGVRCVTLYLLGHLPCWDKMVWMGRSTPAGGTRTGVSSWQRAQRDSENEQNTCSVQGTRMTWPQRNCACVHGWPRWYQTNREDWGIRNTDDVLSTADACAHIGSYQP